MKNKVLLLLLLLCQLSLTSQTFNVFGKVTDENDSSAIGAAVVLLNASDSSLFKGVTTNLRGTFRFEEVPANTYVLKISYIGYKDIIQKITISENARLGKFKLQALSKTLKEIEVKTTAIIATQNGDTSSYNANAFKTNKDAMAEDLITKMPGVTVVDGKIQAQGEDVKQVLVDGKPFFGDDPNAVLKNLPAEVIDKVQVFDRRSDQSQFTGFDDGSNNKTINIITKTQFRNGVFVRVYGGYGYEDKYKSGAVVNRFKDKQRLTIMAMSNNINEQNFSADDLLGVMSGGSNNQRGGGGRGGMRGQGGSGRSGGGSQSNNSDNFLVNAKNGISTTHAFGLNYTDQWGKNTSITASYFFNLTNNEAKSDLLRQYLIGNNSGLNYSEGSVARSDNFNHRLSLRFEHKLDSFNSVLLQPKLSFQINNGSSTINGVNTKTVDISKTSNSSGSNLTGYNISVPMLFRHSFRKRGRTVSLDLNPSYSPNSGNSNFISYNNFLTDSVYADTVDQRSSLSKYTLNSSGNITYTEPINSKSFVSANYQLIYNYSESDKNTFNRDLTVNDYSLRDSLVSNVFNTGYIAHNAGLSYSFQKESYNFSFGVSGQQAELRRDQIFPSSSTSARVFTSILPNAQFQYKLGNKKNFRINYRTSNSPPSLDQLQDVLNNSNSLQLSIGNPELKQNFQNNLFMRYSGVNTEKSTAFFVMLGGTYTDNYIGNSTIIAANDTIVYDKIALAKGSQITRPVNLNNNYSLRTFINYSMPLKGLKTNLNLNAGCNYNNTPALINDKTNYSKTTIPSFGIVLSSNISENFDFMISSNTSYNNVVNTIQTDLNSSFLSQNSKAKVNVTLMKKLVLHAEYNNQLYSGLTQSFNQNIHLLNAAIALKFLKDNKGELRLYVFDILDQNKSINRTVTETYIEDSKTNILQRYFMLTFTYTIKKYFQKAEDKKGS